VNASIFKLFGDASLNGNAYLNFFISLFRQKGIIASKMGLFNWLHTTGAKVYNAIRNGVSTGYHAVKNVVQKVGQVKDVVQNVIDHAKKLPIVGALASAVEAHPYYQMAKKGIEQGTQAFEQGEAIAKPIAEAIDKGASALTGLQPMGQGSPESTGVSTGTIS
jgi:hypothetical protein